MRRLSGSALLLTAALLLLSSGQALALTHHSRAGLLPIHRLGVAGRACLSRPGDSSGPYSITGTVLDYDGTPLSHAEVQWGWFDPNAAVWIGPDVVYHLGADSQTGADGSFSFAGIASHAGSDALTVFNDDASPGDLMGLGTWNNDFSTQSTYALQPGHVVVTITHHPTKGDADLVVGDVATGDAQTTVVPVAGSAVACALSPGFRAVEAHFENSTGSVLAAVDWVSPADALVPVSPGTTAVDSVTLDWSQAKRAFIAGPLCQHSGKPGSLVKLMLKNWPAGQQASFYGLSFSSSSLLPHFYSDLVTSSGAGKTYVVWLRIPKSARVGDIYCLGTYRSDDPASLLDLYDYFQVCTFRASQSAIQRGAAIRLRGTVPGSGYADVFMRHSRAGQPTSWRSPKGWLQVGQYRLKQGRLTTDRLHPLRTTWYVARYSRGDFPAYTSVVKVRVH